MASFPLRRLVRAMLGAAQLLAALAVLCALGWMYGVWPLPPISARTVAVFVIGLLLAACGGTSGWRTIAGRAAQRAQRLGAAVSYLLTGVVALALLVVSIGSRTDKSVLHVSERLRMIVNPLRISGSVVDAETGAPVPGLSITVGSPSGPRYAWSARESPADGAALFETVLHQPLLRVRRGDGQLATVVLKFSAPGYESLISAPFTQSGRSVTFDAKLRKAAIGRGRVVADDGTPVSQARVWIVSDVDSNALWLTKSGIARGDGESTEADAEGRFQFARPTGGVHLVVAGEPGFGAASGGASGIEVTIALRPWARIDGRWRTNGNQPAVRLLSCSAGAESNLTIFPEISYEKAGGRFAVERIPAGPFSISWQPERSRDAGEWSLELVAGDTTPGQLLQLECATEFRAVRGRIRGMDDGGSARYSECQVALRPVHDVQPPMPENLETPEERQSWRDAWDKTELGRNYREVSHRRRQFRVQANGEFLCTTVVPGNYVVEGVWLTGNQALAQLVEKQVEITADASPLDLGEFLLTANRKRFLRVGDAAPEFSVPTLDGGQAQLKKRPGKFVLLDFWATDCPPCVAEIDSLKKAFARFKDTDRITMVSLDMDRRAETAKKLVDARDMRWTQGFLEGGWKNSVAQAYGVDGIPAIFLVSPDGKIVARGLRGSEIEATIAEALGR